MPSASGRPGLHRALGLTWLCQDLGEGAAGGPSWAPWSQPKSGGSWGDERPWQSLSTYSWLDQRDEGTPKAPRQLFP